MLNDMPFAAILPAEDLDRARAFYTEKLGLPEPRKVAPRTLEFRCREGTRLVVYQREGGTQAKHTVAGWMSDDVERTVEELRQKGIEFEQYDQPNLKTDERGIAVVGRAKSAWFKDPEGNILTITETPE
jgi:catechol 2,3-dioxygenase-like lactoylglutathione lyase family enzyme